MTNFRYNGLRPVVMDYFAGPRKTFVTRLDCREMEVYVRLSYIHYKVLQAVMTNFRYNGLPL